MDQRADDGLRHGRADGPGAGRKRRTVKFFEEIAKNQLTTGAVPVIMSKRFERPQKTVNARVVELADSLDSGSSVHYGRAGSSPASRTRLM